MTTEKLLDLLREVAPDRNHTLRCERIGDDPECLRCRIDAALASHTDAGRPLPRDVLCPKCGTPKTNPYKCERCSEYWGPR
jgi:primosomal protein N'